MNITELKKQFNSIISELNLATKLKEKIELNEDYVNKLLNLHNIMTTKQDFRGFLEKEYNGENSKDFDLCELAKSNPILEENYKSPDINIITEEVFAELRNNVLLEEGGIDKEKMDRESALRAIATATLPQLILLYAISDSKKQRLMVHNARQAMRFGLDQYGHIQRFFKLLPNIEAAKKNGNLKSLIDREAFPHIHDRSGRLNFKALHSTQDAAGKWKWNASKSLLSTLGAIILAAGITAAVIKINQYYSQTASDIRRICGRYPEYSKDYRKCELTLKLRACDDIINRLEQSMSICNRKDNPYQCMNQINKQLYAWKARKADYESKLKRLQY